MSASALSACASAQNVPIDGDGAGGEAGGPSGLAGGGAGGAGNAGATGIAGTSSLGGGEAGTTAAGSSGGGAAGTGGGGAGSPAAGSGGTAAGTDGASGNSGTGGSPAACGNGVREGSEQCDAGDLGDKTCADVAGAGETGTLSCTVTCSFDTSMCVAASKCGNGAIDTGEQCDGTALGSDTCATLIGASSTGTVACTSACKYDTSGCSAVSLCGNGTIDAGEDCDGSNVGGKTCADVKSGTTGSLTCTSSCKFDESACKSSCGNGVLDPGEECDAGSNSGDPNARCDANCNVVCQDVEEEFNSHCYFGLMGDAPWQDVENFCEMYGAYLVSFGGSDQNVCDDEEGWIYNRINDDIWIGLTTQDDEVSWQWTSGESFGCTEWNTGEPNDKNHNEHCGQLELNTGLWNDNSCSTNYSGYCEATPAGQ